MHAFSFDLRYTRRTLAKQPALVLAGLLVLGIAIGVNTAIFSVINAILFRPLPVRAPGELRYLYGTVQGIPNISAQMQYRHFLVVRERRDAFSDVLLMNRLTQQVRIAGDVHGAQGEMVSSNYFDVLGVKPLIGRGFVWTEDEPANAPPVSVISYDLWQSRFLGNPEILGKTIDLQTAGFFGSYGPWKSFTIVGVMPRGFKGISNPWDSTQYWVPFLQRATNLAEEYRRMGRRVGTDPMRFGGLPVGRLAPGVSSEEAAAVLGAVAHQIRPDLPSDWPDYAITLSETRRIRLPFDPQGQIVPGRLATALMSVSGVLLLVAAANFTGILLARGVSRTTELAVRVALGAGRWRLRRQLITESLLLSAGGGLLALLVARWLVDLFIAGTPTRFVRWQISALALDVPLDWRVLLVTAATCLVTGLFVGLVAARHALRTDMLPTLNGQSSGPTRGMRATLQRWVVVPQVCFSLVLLLMAGVLVRTMIRSELLHPGYDARPVALLDVGTPRPPEPRDAPREFHRQQRNERIARARRLLEQASRAPGLAAVTVAVTDPMMTVPLPSMHAWVAAREGFTPEGRHYWTAEKEVTADYFNTLSIPLLRGRGFDDLRDREDAPRVAIVSEDLARWMWPGRDPMGQYLAKHFPDSPYPPQWMEVVGVVGNVRLPLADGAWSPAFYVPFQQGNVAHSFTVAARGSGTGAKLFETLKQAMTAADAEALTSNPRMMQDGIDEMLYPRRVAAAILGLAGAIGLLLASMGLYGVVSYSVAQRIREIGVRMALGADRFDIIRLIVREGLEVTVAGIGLGFVMTYTAITLTSRLVVALPSIDAITFVCVPLLLAGVIVIACYIPALRAAKVDPMVVLRGL